MMRPDVGDYLEMIAMPSFARFERPFYARIVHRDHTNYTLLILCGGYASGHGVGKYPGEEFSMPLEPLDRISNLTYRYFREADAPDEMWAAIAAAALTDERNG